MSPLALTSYKYLVGQSTCFLIDKVEIIPISQDSSEYTAVFFKISWKQLAAEHCF